jgi:hypothetical protein
MFVARDERFPRAALRSNVMRKQAVLIVAAALVAVIVALLAWLGGDAQAPVEAATVAAPGFAPTAAFWIPPMADQTCFVAVSKLGGRLELVLALPRVLATRGRFEALRDELVATQSVDARSISASASSG